MRLSRLLLLGAAGLLLLPAGASAQEEPGSGFTSYVLLANAPGLGLDGLYRDVALTVPEVTSTLRTGAVGSGFASLAWPGPVIGNGGSTLLVLQPALPPETVLLNSPVRAEARTGGAEKVTSTAVPGTLMAATAQPEQATADATFNSTALPIGTAGAMTSSSRVALEGARKAVATARTETQDLSLAEGMITIGSVVSEAVVTSAAGKATATGATAVSGMEIAGVPVTVDGSGISVAGTSVPNPVPAQTVNEAIAALGLQVLLTEPRTVANGSSASYDAGALVLLYTQGGDQYALTLGRASASVDVVEGVAVPEGPAQERPAAPVVTAPVPTGGNALPVGAAPPPVGALPLRLGAPVADTAAPPVPAPVSVPPAAAAVALEPVSFDLAAGIPLLLTLVGLALSGLVAAALRRLPDRVLALPRVVCDERPLS